MVSVMNLLHGGHDHHRTLASAPSAHPPAHAPPASLPQRSPFAIHELLGLGNANNNNANGSNNGNNSENNNSSATPSPAHVRVSDASPLYSSSANRSAPTSSVVGNGAFPDHGRVYFGTAFMHANMPVAGMGPVPSMPLLGYDHQAALGARAAEAQAGETYPIYY